MRYEAKDLMIARDQALVDLKLAACQFEQAEREWSESPDYRFNFDGAPYINALRGRAALEDAAIAYAKLFQ
jgi:hypothetical protein